MNETGIRLSIRPDAVGNKKLKLTARGFAVAVSLNFYPDRAGRFHNLANFIPNRLHFFILLSHSFTWKLSAGGFNFFPAESDSFNILW